jgi:hypothetical protein
MSAVGYDGDLGALGSDGKDTSDDGNVPTDEELKELSVSRPGTAVLVAASRSTVKIRKD